MDHCFVILGAYERQDLIFELIRFLVLNITFSNISAISWRRVLVVAEAGVSGENHRP
jgi:hypothetical protein